MLSAAERAELERRVLAHDARRLRGWILIGCYIAIMCAVGGVFTAAGACFAITMFGPGLTLFRQQWTLGRLLADDAAWVRAQQRLPVADLRAINPWASATP
jgi:hypothetical protein